MKNKVSVWIFDEATSSLDSNTAEHFAATINQLKGKVTMLFITHAMPKNLLVDEVVRIGQGALSAVSDAHDEHRQEAEEGRMDDLSESRYTANGKEWRMVA